MPDHFHQRLNALRVCDLVHEANHHGYIPIRGEDAGLDQTLLADNLEMKLVAQALRQLTHKLPLRSAISFSERMDTIDLGKQSGEFAGEVPTRQSLEKMFLRQFAKYSANSASINSGGVNLVPVPLRRNQTLPTGSSGIARPIRKHPERDMNESP